MEILVLIVILYMLFILIALFGFSLINLQITLNHPSKNLDPSLSLIIPFRNEENRVFKLLKSIDNQTDLSLISKIIFVDDHSTDESSDFIKKWISKKPFNCELKKLQSYFGKKRAIDLAIHSSNTDYLMILDADVSFNPCFFKKLRDIFHDNEDLFIIPVIENTGVYYSKTISFVISILTIGMASLKLPILANGAALIMKKNSYLKTNPFANNFHISSGDDMFLLKCFNENSMRIKSVFDSELIVYTEGSDDFKSTILRSLRWSGKMNSSGFALTKILGALVLICNLLIWPLIIYGFIFSMPEVLLFVGIKFLTDFIALVFACFKFKNFSLLKYSLFTFLLYPLIIKVIIFLSLIKYRFKWKDRDVIKS